MAFGHFRTTIHYNQNVAGYGVSCSEASLNMNEGEENTNSQYASPCIRHCCLNADDICLGCYRALDEILDWSASDDEGKKEILRKCELRRANKGLT